MTDRINFVFRRQKGSLLVYTLVILSISSILFAGYVQVILSQVRFGLVKSAREESLQVAEAGIYFYRWYLAHQTGGRTKQQIYDFWTDAGDPPYGVGSAWEQDYEGVGRYSITVTPPTSLSSTIAIVESTGWTYKHPEQTRTVRVRFRQPSWSEYSVLCDSDIRFGDGTEAFGPIHSNGGIRFDGVAHNIVSSLQEEYTDPDTHLLKDGVWTNWSGEYNPNMGNDVFLAGKDFPVAEVEFNGVASDFALIKELSGCGTPNSYCSDTSSGQNLYFNNANYGRHVVLNSDGTVDVSRVLGYDGTSLTITSESSATSYTIPDDGVIFVEDNVWIEGQINGKHVTIVAADMSGGSDRDVYIEHDIRYTNYDGTDTIGIIAQDDVSVIRESEDDLRIDAALLAYNGRVGRPYYGTYCVHWHHGHCDTWVEDHKDTITVFGSIATRERYGFAYTDGTGYTNRNLIYDNNFVYYPPPYFPTGTEYAIDMWEEL